MNNENQIPDAYVEDVENQESLQESVQAQYSPLRALKWLTVIVSFIAVGLSMAQNPEHVERTTLEGAMMALVLLFIIFAIKGHNGLRRSEAWHCYLFSGMSDLLLGVLMTVLNILSVVVMVVASVNFQRSDGWEILIAIAAACIFYLTLKHHWTALSRIRQNDEFSAHGYEDTNPPTWLLYGRVYLLFKGLVLALACSATAQSMMTSLRKAGSHATVRVKEALEMDWKAVRLYGRTATIQDVLFNALVLNIVLFFCKRVWEDVLLRTKESESRGFSWFNAYTYVVANLVSLGLVVGCTVTAFGLYGKAMEEKLEKPSTSFEAAPAVESSSDASQCLNEEQVAELISIYVACYRRKSVDDPNLKEIFAENVELPDKAEYVSRESIIPVYRQFFSLFRDIKVSDIQVGICGRSVQLNFRAQVRDNDLNEGFFYGFYTFGINTEGRISSIHGFMDSNPMPMADEYVRMPYVD